MAFSIFIRLGLIASTTLSLAPIALAEDDDTIEEFVITAGRRSQAVGEVAKSVSVISEYTLVERQYQYVVDALQSLPGVAINQNGAFGGAATVSIRGAGTDQTLVLIDGVQVNDPSSVGGAFDFSRLDPAGIERIEVLRGPQAVLYGSDAIGGVINIITKGGAGSAGLAGNGSAEYGAFDSFRLGGALNGGSETIGFNLSASYQDTDGISAADTADGNTESDGFKNLSLRGKAIARLSEVARFEVSTSYTDSESEYDGFALLFDGSFGLGDTADNSKSEEFSIAGRAMVDLFGGRLSNTLSLEYSTINRDNFSADTFTFGAQGERLNLDYLAVAKLAEVWSLTAGAQHEEISAKSVDPDTISTDSLFGLLSFSGIDGLIVSGGLRIDDHETFGSTTNGELHASYELASTGTRVTAVWGEGFKAPSIFQLTFSCCGFEPNPDLIPERAKAWEVGIEQPIMAGKAQASATYFEQDTEELIIFTFTGGYRNIARSRAKGVELAFDAVLGDTLSFDANYTYTSAKDLATDTRLPRRPKHSAFASLNWQAGERLGANMSITHNGNELDTTGITLDAWTRVDLRLAYQLTDTLELFGRVDNLLDEAYQQVAGYGTPGISAYGGVRARF